jgi:FlaG/FlaF family flagellin (archaellin)
MLKSVYNNDKAVSDVIGIILLVVIVTILASVVALFVYTYLQSINQPYMIDFTVARLTPQTIEIMNNGGPSLASLNTSATNYLIVSINGVDTNSTSGILNNAVSSSAIYPASSGSHVVIIGLFVDGSEYKLYDGTA